MPTLEQIDSVRQRGFRPVVVGCVVHDGKLLMVFHEEYKLWQLAQGGIENGEDLNTALCREMKEELGEDFGGQITFGTLIHEDEVEFLAEKRGTRPMNLDDGSEVMMRGKRYYAVVCDVASSEFDIEKSEFDDHQWCTGVDALKIADEISQRGKRRITRRMITALIKGKKIEK